jgi:hypothetical protein
MSRGADHMSRTVTTVMGLVLSAALVVSAVAQQPTVLNAAVGSNVNHVPSFVGVEKASS